MRDFVHERLPGRVVFGVGAVGRVPDELAALGCQRVLVVAGGAAEAIGARLVLALGDQGAGHITRVAQHVPEPLAAEAAAAARDAAADGLCSVGGGSATGLAKAVAVELDLPLLAVPTTYAASEVTPIYGLTGTRKRTVRDLRALPRTVVYDPALTTGLPARPTASSGFNALAHAVAALGNPEADPVAVLYAEASIRLAARALPTAVAEPADLEARSALLQAAYLAGSAIAAAGPRLHHRLCHLIGGRYRLVHADVHAVLLPHTTAADDTLASEGRQRVASALAADDAAAGLHALAAAVGAPTALAELGLPDGDLDDLAAEAADADSAPSHDAAWFAALLRAAHGAPA